MTPGAMGMMGIRKKAKTGGADCENGEGFLCCTQSYKLVELYGIVQGEENEGKRVCGADRGCGGIKDAGRFASAAGAEAGDGIARAFAREVH